MLPCSTGWRQRWSLHARGLQISKHGTRKETSRVMARAGDDQREELRVEEEAEEEEEEE